MSAERRGCLCLSGFETQNVERSVLTRKTVLFHLSTSFCLWVDTAYYRCVRKFLNGVRRPRSRMLCGTGLSTGVWAFFSHTHTLPNAHIQRLHLQGFLHGSVKTLFRPPANSVITFPSVASPQGTLLLPDRLIPNDSCVMFVTFAGADRSSPSGPKLGSPNRRVQIQETALRVSARRKELLGAVWIGVRCGSATAAEAESKGPGLFRGCQRHCWPILSKRSSLQFILRGSGHLCAATYAPKALPRFTPGAAPSLRGRNSP